MFSSTPIFSASIVGDIATSKVTATWIAGNATATSTYTHTAQSPEPKAQPQAGCK